MPLCGCHYVTSRCSAVFTSMPFCGCHYVTLRCSAALTSTPFYGCHYVTSCCSAAFIIFIFILLRYSVAAIINKAALRQLLPYHSVVVDIRPRAALRPHHVMYIIPAFLGESLPSFAALAWPVFGWAEGASPPACDQGLSSLVTMRGPSPKQRLLVLF